MLAVVVHDDERGEITVSAYKRPASNTLNKIKKAGDIAYEKARDAGLPGETDPENLAGLASGDTHRL
jgi:hypothetical protein